ncbi:MAG: metal ABC transporter ATP-binding protein [Gammaproteobacteria bacterium]|nr:metal ABC transporter ATP-binding protein [Gammaproteobacteria bacterium]
MSAAIEINTVNFSYGGPPVLADVSCVIERGELFGLIGPNGGGKTTLVKLMLGLLRPDSGQVRVLGMAPASARVRVGYCPQHIAFTRRFPITVEEVVMLGRLGRTRWFGGFGGGDRRHAHAALEAVEILALRRKAISMLSGGELQRVLIARALVSEPEVLIMDESTANVDYHANAEIFELLAGLAPRITIIVVSHDLGFISRYVSRVGCVNRTLECHPVAALDEGVLDRLYESRAALVDHAKH